MYSLNDLRFFTVSVSTFGYPRIEAYLQLPAAFRSLSRPSSAPCAKAFTLCSCSLELPLLISLSCSRSSLELLEFHKHFFRLLIHFVKRLPFRTLNLYFSTCGEIVFTLLFKKDQMLIKTNLVIICLSFSQYLFVSTLQYTLFGFQ